jgi:processive 1,2-diacylglycerol beta-glucosyltransferase
METTGLARPKILILTVSHGGSHRRAADALRKALLEIRPGLTVDVVDALEHCARWFRTYYDSYEIVLKYWPTLWKWIENFQHQQPATGPTWLYRRGGQPLFRFIQEFDPDIVIATEVGMCELAAILKRETRARFFLVGVELMDFNRAWVQPEVDLYPADPGDLATELEAAGAPPGKILPCGIPVDPAFASLPARSTARMRLGIKSDLPLVLILFGGTGFGNPRQILAALNGVEQPLQAVIITGRNRQLEEEVRRQCNGRSNIRVFGWVDNIHEWMAAADLLVSKPGGGTVAEAINCGLPILAFAPLPGNECRIIARIEKWGVGYWVKRPEDLAPSLRRLLANSEELERLRERARARARPRAAFDAAQATLDLFDHGG